MRTFTVPRAVLCALRYCTVQYSTCACFVPVRVQSSPVQSSSVQSSTVQYSTVQYSTIFQLGLILLARIKLCVGVLDNFGYLGARSILVTQQNTFFATGMLTGG